MKMRQLINTAVISAIARLTCVPNDEPLVFKFCNKSFSLKGKLFTSAIVVFVLVVYTQLAS